MNTQANTHKVALITGSAQRIGAHCARMMHSLGYNLVIHCHRSVEAGERLVESLNQQRANSACLAQADLLQVTDYKRWVDSALQTWGRLDVLINNASSFYPTPIDQADLNQWEDLLGSNLKAPYFLIKACLDYFNQDSCIINITDTHTDKPLKNYSIYNIAKAGLNMLTKSLAKELSPIRVNAIAPGAILWPTGDNELSTQQQEKILEKTLLKRPGTPEEIALAIKFLCQDATYTTGQILKIDGGRF